MARKGAAAGLYIPLHRELTFDPMLSCHVMCAPIV
jgi:hypothetical protein